MKKIKAILILLMIYSVVLFSGCTDDSEDENSKELKKFVGIWRNYDDTASYVFYSKGTFIFDSIEVRYEGSYKINNKLLFFTYTSPSDLEGEVESFNYSFSNDNTVFTISPYDHPEYSAVFYKNQN